MKKRIQTLSFIFIFLGVHATQAQLKEGIGIGIMLGEPTGLNFKLRTVDEQAVAVGAAWSFTDNPSFQFQMDYLLHNFETLYSPGQKNSFVLYYGLGGRVRLKDNSANKNKDNETLIGLRLPLGISYLFRDAPVDFFGELAPILDIVPDTAFGWGAAFGARIYF